jgi:heme oxygenase
MSVTARLLAELRPQHFEADADLHVLLNPHVTRDAYVRHLRRAYGFEAPLEARLAAFPGLDRSLDLHHRTKTDLIAADLRALGTGVRDVARLPSCKIPVLRDEAEAIGWMYVVERATLLHAAVRAHLATHLPLLFGSASRYVSCYAGETGAAWARFMTTLDRIASTDAGFDRLLTTARIAFGIRRRWMREEGLDGIELKAPS